MRGAALLLLLLPLLPGCLAPPDEGPAQEWRFEGTFTRDYRPEDMRAVCREAAGREICEFGMSDPPYYSFPSPSRGECEDLRARIEAWPRTRLLSGCARVEWERAA